MPSRLKPVPQVTPSAKRLLQRYPGPHQTWVFRRYQPHRNALEVVFHQALFGKRLGKTAGQKEIGETRHHAATNVHTATTANGQHIIAGHAPQPGTELL